MSRRVTDCFRKVFFREAKRKQQLPLLSTARFLVGPHSHDIMICREMVEKGVFLLWAICLLGPARTT